MIEDGLMPTAAPLQSIEEIDDGCTPRAEHSGVFDRVQEVLMQLHVSPGIEQVAVAGQPIAPGSSDLLVPGLYIARHVAVNDESYVRFVDAHAERDGKIGRASCRERMSR